jgi:hypothetical protein
MNNKNDYFSKLKNENSKKEIIKRKVMTKFNIFIA